MQIRQGLKLSPDQCSGLDLLPGSAAGISRRQLALERIQRRPEPTLVIAESQERFALQRAVEAIQLLRHAHELDENRAPDYSGQCVS
jgi:hypothetical protein